MSNKNKKIKTDDNEDVTVELYRTISQEAKNTCRSKLLECLQQEQNSSVRDKIGDAVAEVARQYAELGISRSHPFPHSNAVAKVANRRELD